jgi:hypothetical protein
MKTICQLISGVAVLTLSATAGMAADTTKIPELEGGSTWIAWLFGAVALAGICVVGFKNSRRTHLD